MKKRELLDKKKDDLIYQLSKQPNAIGKEWRERVGKLESEITQLKPEAEAESIMFRGDKLLNQFFNHKSDANKYLMAEEQEDLEKEFGKWCQKTVRE